MEAYLNARMIRTPLCMLDMDIPVDGADAFILTTTEKARKLTKNPVVVHAATAGMVGKNDEDQLPSLERHGQHIVVEALKERSDVWIDDIDVFFPYDGFSIITLGWIENMGFAKPGQAGRWMQDHWDDARGGVMIDGRVPMNPHGGSLSEGASRGTGHLREAVTQLRGDAGEATRREVALGFEFGVLVVDQPEFEDLVDDAFASGQACAEAALLRSARHPAASETAAAATAAAAAAGW